MEGDLHGLRQVTTNVLKNAVQNTLAGIINVVMAYKADQGQLFITIVDSGSGMTHEQVESSQEMLGFLMRTAEQNSNGIGLGLFICRGIVKRNNGFLRIHSHGQNKGTIVEFSVKVKLKGSGSGDATNSAGLRVRQALTEE